MLREDLKATEPDSLVEPIHRTRCNRKKAETQEVVSEHQETPFHCGSDRLS